MDTLDAYLSGTIPFEDLVTAVREHEFTQIPDIPQSQEIASDPPPDSWEEIAKAVMTGKLTMEQYKTLWAAKHG